jgi:hypothetical protein
MPKLSYGVHVLSGDHLAASLEALVPSHPHLRPLQATLQEALAEMRSAKDRQQTLRAAAQQATRDLEAAIEKAKQVSVRLHSGLLAIHGTKSAKLLEFGMRPHRSARLRRAAGEAIDFAAVTDPEGGAVPPPEAVVAAAEAEAGSERGSVPQPEAVIAAPEATADSGRGSVPQPKATPARQAEEAARLVPGIGPERGTAPQSRAPAARRREDAGLVPRGDDSEGTEAKKVESRPWARPRAALR